MVIKIFKSIVAAFMVLFLFWFAGGIWFSVTTITAQPDQSEVKEDALVVLTGGQERINTALDLLDKGYAEKLFISGVNQDVKASDLIHLWGGNTDICCIDLGYNAKDTKGNAIESKDWIKDNNFKSIRLITSNYHMARAAIEFKNTMPDIHIYKHPVHAISKDRLNFWKVIFEEYNKTLIAWLQTTTI